MEIVYEGPRSSFAEFGTVLCEKSGADGYILDGVLTKGWVTDEIVRYVVQFDPEEAHFQFEILAALVQWAANKSSSIHVSIPGHEIEDPESNADESSNEA